MAAFPIFRLFAETLEMRKNTKNEETKKVFKSKWIQLKLEPDKIHLKRDIWHYITIKVVHLHPWREFSELKYANCGENEISKTQIAMLATEN